MLRRKLLSRPRTHISARRTRPPRARIASPRPSATRYVRAREPLEERPLSSAAAVGRAFPVHPSPLVAHPLRRPLFKPVYTHASHTLPHPAPDGSDLEQATGHVDLLQDTCARSRACTRAYLHWGPSQGPVASDAATIYAIMQIGNGGSRGRVHCQENLSIRPGPPAQPADPLRSSR